MGANSQITHPLLQLSNKTITLIIGLLDIIFNLAVQIRPSIKQGNSTRWGLRARGCSARANGRGDRSSAEGLPREPPRHGAQTASWWSAETRLPAHECFGTLAHIPLEGRECHLPPSSRTLHRSCLQQFRSPQAARRRS